MIFILLFKLKPCPMKKNLPNLLIEKEKSRPDELTYAELLQLTKTYAEQSFQEHSGESSGTESDNSGPIPSQVIGRLFSPSQKLKK